ncbi:MAG: hypothetical protein ACOZNI_14680, partial [Myxococcota bacterium]
MLGPADAAEVAERFSPVIYQDVADGFWGEDEYRRLDLLAAVDFDGNLDALDNVENAATTALPGVVYWDVIETETHLYVLYAFFHPVDWNDFNGVDHENDMEHAWLVVEKHADGSLSLAFVHTQAHGQLLAWTDGDVAGDGFDVSEGGLSLEGEHPRLFVEAHGHGPASCSHGGGLPFVGAIDCDPADDEDMVVYRAGQTSAEPDVSADAPVEATYVLVSSREALWPHAASRDLWDEFFTYAPSAGDFEVNGALGYLGHDMAGDEGGGAGTAPWGYLVDDSFLGGTTYGARGDWLFDPAALYATLYDDPCEANAGFRNYLSNPYLDELATSALPWDGEDRGRRCDGVEAPPPVEDTGDTGAGDTHAGEDT